MNNYLNIEQAAEMLHIKVDTLRHMNMRRVIPYFNPTGRKCLYRQEDIENYICSVRISSASQMNAIASSY